MDIADIVRQNAKVIEANSVALRQQAAASARAADALRDEVAELKHFGEKLDERTSALMDAFAMLAADLRRGDGGAPAR